MKFLCINSYWSNHFFSKRKSRESFRNSPTKIEGKKTSRLQYVTWTNRWFFLHAFYDKHLRVSIDAYWVRRNWFGIYLFFVSACGELTAKLDRAANTHSIKLEAALSADSVWSHRSQRTNITIRVYALHGVSCMVLVTMIHEWCS